MKVKEEKKGVKDESLIWGIRNLVVGDAIHSNKECTGEGTNLKDCRERQMSLVSEMLTLWRM